jgi:hypothetical protein
MATEYSALDNQRVSAANGVSYAYRDTGSSASRACSRRARSAAVSPPPAGCLVTTKNTVRRS